MATQTPWLVATAAALLLGGCASGPQLMYTWGDYQPTLYQYFQKEKSAPEQQASELTEIIEKSKADKRPVPPGLHAHLGLLYLHMGKGVEAQQEFTTEKTMYPESGPYMDFLISSKEQKQ